MVVINVQEIRFELTAKNRNIVIGPFRSPVRARKVWNSSQNLCFERGKIYECPHAHLTYLRSHDKKGIRVAERHIFFISKSSEICSKKG